MFFALIALTHNKHSWLWSKWFLHQTVSPLHQPSHIHCFVLSLVPKFLLWKSRFIRCLWFFVLFYKSSLLSWFQVPKYSMYLQTLKKCRLLLHNSFIFTSAMPVFVQIMKGCHIGFIHTKKQKSTIFQLKKMY